MTSSAGTRRRHVARFTAPSPPCGLSSRCIPSSQCHRCTVGVGDRQSSAKVFKRSVTLVAVIVTLMSCATCSPLGDGELTAASKSGSQKYSNRAAKYNDSRRDIQQRKVVSNDVALSEYNQSLTTGNAGDTSSNAIRQLIVANNENVGAALGLQALPSVENNAISAPGSDDCLTANSDTTASSDTRQQVLQRLPQAIIVGVKKGGTRALLEFLRVHPDVRAPGPEVHFFDRNYEKGLEWYRSRMPLTSSCHVTIEKTPSYFVTRGAAGRVYNMSRDVRLIVVVRDPVTRAVSDYVQAVSKRPDLGRFEARAFVVDAGDARRPTTTAVNGTSAQTRKLAAVASSWGPIRIGLYARHLRQWFQYFPREQMHFVSGERLVEDPAAELRSVERFLGLRPFVDGRYFYFNATKGFPCLRLRHSADAGASVNASSGSRSSPTDVDISAAAAAGNVINKTDGTAAAATAATTTRCLGKNKGRTHPNIDPDVLQRLREFYRPHNEMFYRMTGIDFGWH